MALDPQHSLADTLLKWFDKHARDLPWRYAVSPSDKRALLKAMEVYRDRLPEDISLSIRRDPYTVIVSEFMLQQTQVTTVIPYYERFLEAFPTIQALSKANETDVLKFWEGLGYYRRARYLSAFAKQVATEYDGVIPADKKLLLSLPGIGEYTAGAILSFAFDLPEPAVDGNIVRIFSRLDAKPHMRGDAKAIRSVRHRVTELIPESRAGDFNEALMDLGATICTPSSPQCTSCPLDKYCQALALDEVDAFPLRPKIDKKPVAKFSYVLLHRDGSVFVRCRPKGLLEGLYEFFSLPKQFRKKELVDFQSSLKEEFLKTDYKNEIFRDHFVGESREVYTHCRKALKDISDLIKQKNISFVGKKRVVYSHRIWEVSLWEVKLSQRLGVDDEPYLDSRNEKSTIGFVSDGRLPDHDKGVWVTLEELSKLPFPSVLVPWRDDFIARHR